MGRRSRRGSEAVEFAILAPFWLTLTMAIVDYGWYGFHVATLNTSVHVGCRQASIQDPMLNNTNLDALLTDGEQRMEDHYTSDGPGCGSEGCRPDIRSVGSPPYRSLLCEMETNYEPIVGIAMDASTLRSATVMRMEYQRFN